MVKNKIVFKEKIKNTPKYKEQLLLLTYQKPNNKLFYIFPLKLGIYNLANDNKRETKFKWWLKNKLGEPPVVFKEPLVLSSANSMRNYMFNLGYLHNTVSTEIQEKKKKVKVIYTISPNELYKINKISFPKAKDDITKIINEVSKKSLLKAGNHLNINTLDEERKRISKELKDRGYFFFNKEYISFDIDSMDLKQRVNLKMVLNPPKNENGQKKFKLNEIYIYTDYSVNNASLSLQPDSFVYDGYHFISHKNMFKPKALLFGVFFKKGDVYSLKNDLKTQKKIVSFGAFKFVNIEYKLSEDKENNLDVHLFLTPAKKQAISGDVELSHSFAGLSGIVVSATYKNKNLTKRSDLLQFKVSAGVELNLFDKTTKNILNTADITTDLSYYVNRFIVPFPLKKVSKNSNVKTKFAVQYNYEQRIQRFSKHAFTFTAGYEWNETQTKKHFYNPISATLLLIPKIHPTFQEQLDTLPSLRHSFDENIILGSTYTFLYTNKKSDADRSHFKFQGDIYLAGNLVHAIALLAKRKSGDTIPYKIFNKEYAQFARFEGNIVHSLKIGNNSELVTRLNSGIIIPYGNSDVAPYFQQFTVGGPNSIRAFRLRALGPGSYATEKSFESNNFLDQSGDFKLEANIEYRFDIWKWFKWAFFVDAGNVWTLKDIPDRPGGVIKGDFYKTIAVGFGAGLRLDFNYFVIRTDLAMPIVDPRFEPSKRFRLTKDALGISQWSKNNLRFNLAIGYPF